MLECDASNLAIGAVLNQEGKLVYFHTKKLNEAKRKYYSYDLEIYALVQDLRKWRHYLLPEEFVVYTNNQELSFLNSQDKLSHKHMKWVEYIQDYTFTIMYKKGVANKVEDSPSTRLLIVQEIQLISVGLDNFKDMYSTDEEFSKPYKVFINFHNHFHHEFSYFTLQEGILFKGSDLCVPRDLIGENLIQEKHNGAMSELFGIHKTLDLVQRLYHWPTMSKDLKRYVGTIEMRLLK